MKLPRAVTWTRATEIEATTEVEPVIPDTFPMHQMLSFPMNYKNPIRIVVIRGHRVYRKCPL